MEEIRGKKPRTELFRECGIPTRAIQRLIKQLQDNNISAADAKVSDKDLQRRYGHLIATIQFATSAGMFTWELGKPGAIIKEYMESAALTPHTRMMLTHRGTHPSTPLRLVLYCDEVTPGSALKLNNKRKTNAFYATFVEMPPSLRYHKECWFPLAFMRSSVAKTISGGWTAVGNKLLELMFIGPDSISDVGIVINIDSAPRIVFVQMYALIGDAPALATFMGTKGCNANVPCPLMCSNMTSYSSGLAAHGDTLVDSTCSDRSKIIRTTNDMIWRTVDKLRDRKPHSTKTKFESMEVAAGLQFVPDGVLGNAQLRPYVKPAQFIAVDPMHVLVSNGIVNFELYCLFQSCGWRRCFESMRTLVGVTWHVPLTRGSKLNVFDDAHMKASDNDSKCFKCQASELLAVMPLVRYFVDRAIAPDPSYSAQVASFHNVHDLLVLTTQSKKDGNVSPERLDRAGARHLESFKNAYGADALKPKHHTSSMHLGDNARLFGRVIDCFTQERKGKIVKAASEHIHYTARFERSTLLRVCANELHNLSHPDVWSDCLLGPTSRHAELASTYGASQCLVAKKLRWQQVTYTCDSIVFVDAGSPCLVLAGICFDGCKFALLVAQCGGREQVSTTACRWELREEISYVFFLGEGREIKFPAMWEFEDEKHVLVLER